MERFKKIKEMSKINEYPLFCVDLELILTQKCNLACAHCMRGECSNKEIDESVLDATFSKFAYIDNLALGGGEIALAPQKIREVTKYLKKHGTIVHHCNFTSNGTVVNEETLYALKELYDYVVSCDNKPQLFSSEPGQKDVPMFVCFSFDNYHLEQMVKKGITTEYLFDNIAKYQKVFGTKAIECRLECDIDVYDAGRAKFLEGNVRKVPIDIITNAKVPFTNINNKAILLGNVVCISCDGEIIPTNIPFAEEKIYSYGNIKTSTNSQILTNMKAYETNDNGYNRARNKMRKAMTAPKKLLKKCYPILSYKEHKFMEQLEISIKNAQEKEEKSLEK